jgi:hypothetical protein
MKKSILLLAVLLAFACSALAQDTSSSMSSTQTSTTTKTKKSKKSGGDAMGQDQSGMAMDHGKKMGKSSTLTGCISADANSEGMYTLSNGKYKKGVEIGPADKVKDHAGHQVALTGKWSTAAAAGETTAASAKEKGERHFEVDDVKHISPTCSEAPGGGTMGKKQGKMSKKKDDMSATPKQ